MRLMTDRELKLRFMKFVIRTLTNIYLLVGRKYGAKGYLLDESLELDEAINNMLVEK